MIVGYIDIRGYLYCATCAQISMDETRAQLEDLPERAQREQIVYLYGPIHHDSEPHNAETCDVCHRPILASLERTA